MKSFLSLFILAQVLLVTGYTQDFYYNDIPDFETNASGKIATGLGIADINNDGWKDMIVANGNDIERQNVEVYLNKGDGTFNENPDWESSDIDYHGHLAIGDINQDGWMDVAVSVFIGASGFSDPGKVKVYYNIDGELESTPSFISEEFYSFSCSLGDADADGDLDLAVACGESYNNKIDHARIFINNDGVFDSIAPWKSKDKIGAMDVEFADFDNNGFLDVIFGCDQNPSTLFLADNNGIIDTLPDWESEEDINVNSIDVGFINDDAYPDFFATNNSQLGGNGKNHLWTFSNPIPANSSAAWISNKLYPVRSGILMYDFNNDGLNDLVHGGWWQHLTFQENNGTGFNHTPIFETTQKSVVEAICASDLDKSSYFDFHLTQNILQDNISLIYISRIQLIEVIDSVLLNDKILDLNEYCWIPGEKWVSFKNTLKKNDKIDIYYFDSKSQDLIITNWDDSKGNYIYYNQMSINPAINQSRANHVQLFPNPVINALQIEAQELIEKIEIYTISGKLLLSKEVNRTTVTVDLKPNRPDIYFVNVYTKNRVITRKLVKL